MNNWFEVKCKYTRQLEDGRLKRVTEPYLVDAMSFTEAEERIIKEVGESTPGEFIITAIKRENITDIFAYEDEEVWYSGVLAYRTVDEDSGREKSVRHKMLVTANSVKQADERFKESLSEMLVTYEIKEIKETALVEVFPYRQNSDDQFSWNKEESENTTI